MGLGQGGSLSSLRQYLMAQLLSFALFSVTDRQAPAAQAHQQMLVVRSPALARTYVRRAPPHRAPPQALFATTFHREALLASLAARVEQVAGIYTAAQRPEQALPFVTIKTLVLSDIELPPAAAGADAEGGPGEHRARAASRRAAKRGSLAEGPEAAGAPMLSPRLATLVGLGGASDEAQIARATAHLLHRLLPYLADSAGAGERSETEALVMYVRAATAPRRAADRGGVARKIMQSPDTTRLGVLDVQGEGGTSLLMRALQLRQEVRPAPCKLRPLAYPHRRNPTRVRALAQDMFHALLERGANVHATDDKGCSALHYCCQPATASYRAAEVGACAPLLARRPC